MYWSIHLLNLFNLTEQIGFLYVRAQTTKLVQASTIACSSSAMLEQAQLDALDTLNVSSRGVLRDVMSQAECGLARTFNQTDSNDCKV